MSRGGDIAEKKERKEAFANIKKAAEKFGVEVTEKDWKELADKK